MPVQTGAVNVLDLLKKQGADKAINAHKADETVIGGGGDLPPGIEGGVAQLTDAKLDVHKDGDNKGKPYLYLAGIVVKPETEQGSRASLVVGLYDRPRAQKTFDDQVKIALNEMRKLGINTAAMSGVGDWDDNLALLVQEAPFFRFRTWQGTPTKEFPNPRVNTEFRGLAKGYTGTPDGSSVEDNTNVDPNNPAEPSGEAGTASEDWAALGEAADNGDTDAAEKLVEAGKQFGVDTDAPANWAEAATLIAEAEANGASGGDAGGGDEGAAGSTPWQPEKGEQVMFRPKNAKKDHEAEITQVFSKVLNLKTLADNKAHKSIPWTADPPTLNGHPVNI